MDNDVDSDWFVVTNQVVVAALSQLGKPYVFNTPTNPQDPDPVSFCCSGLTQWSYRKAGIILTHNTNTQFAEMEHRPISEIQLGDLVFYQDAVTHDIYHVCVYVGGMMVVESPNPTGFVQMRPLGLWGPTMTQVGVYQGPVTIPPTVNPVPPRTPDGTKYTVKAGDTLTTIAYQYPDADITATTLATINHMSGPNVSLHAGLSIYIRRPLWKVSAGQNLTQIAAFYPESYITAASIATLNKLSGPSAVLKAGQVLTVG